MREYKFWCVTLSVPSETGGFDILRCNFGRALASLR